MVLPLGTRLGPYEVTAPIDAGAMGEVYRATDTNLKREVAIKVLPEPLATDPERLARFQREAEVLAALNHTNIAHIYGLERGGGITALVMELVEGPTLAHRIAAGPIPADESLSIAKQITEALEAAHERGIVHRDLKPANIKVQLDGTVKVLDFGLARLTETPRSGPHGPMAPDAPTITSPAIVTGAGAILGTAAYMSPEQARGKTVDKRADIWAFGCVLFEMLTGTRPFEGEELAETLAAVIHKEPVWSRVPTATPASVRAVLQRCLQKDPKQRARDIGDVRLALEGAFETAAPQAAAPSPSPSRSIGVAWVIVAVAVLAAAVLAIPTVRHLREAPSPVLPETRTDVVTPAMTDPLSTALSPDGRQLVFVAAGEGQPRLWLRPLDQTAAQPLVGTDGASVPFWSPDGQSLGFVADTQLKRIDLAGGSARTLGPAVARGGAWGPDGMLLFALTAGGPLFRIPATGGEAVAVTTLEPGQQSHRFPQFLPGGRHFLFYALGTPDTQGVYLGSLDGSAPTRLTAADAAGVYAPQGWLLFVQAGTLRAHRLDLERRAVVGDPVTVADQVGFDRTTRAAAVSVSATGLVAYWAGGANRHQLTWFDRSGKALGAAGAPDENDLTSAYLSPDGRRVAVHRTVQGNTDIWLVDADRMTRFTFDAAADRFPLWSPDGSRIVFDSNRNGNRHLYQTPSSSAGSEDLLLESVQNKIPQDWSADGRFISYNSQDPETGYDLWMLPLEGDRKPFVFLQTAFEERRGMFSPDGRWVAYQSNALGSDEVYVRPFPGPGGQWQVSTAGGINPRWAPDGKELYYLVPDGTLMAASVTVNGPTIELGRPMALFRTRILGGGTDVSLGMNYAVARDGRFLINTVLDDAAVPITLLQHWRPVTTP